jgi:hypothetical protein
MPVNSLEWEGEARKWLVEEYCGKTSGQANNDRLMWAMVNSIT